MNRNEARQVASDWRKIIWGDTDEDLARRVLDEAGLCICRPGSCGPVIEKVD